MASNSKDRNFTASKLDDRIARLEGHVSEYLRQPLRPQPTHPFGTIKRAMGADSFLLRGLEKVNAEFSLMATAYNLARAMSLLGFVDLVEAVRG